MKAEKLTMIQVQGIKISSFAEHARKAGEGSMREHFSELMLKEVKELNDLLKNDLLKNED